MKDRIKELIESSSLSDVTLGMILAYKELGAEFLPLVMNRYPQCRNFITFSYKGGYILLNYTSFLYCEENAWPHYLNINLEEYEG